MSNLDDLKQYLADAERALDNARDEVQNAAYELEQMERNRADLETALVEAITAAIHDALEDL